MMDRLFSSMNNAWQSTKEAVDNSVEHAKEATVAKISISDVQVQKANDTYSEMDSSIQTIIVKIELLKSEILACAHHLKTIATIFQETLPENSDSSIKEEFRERSESVVNFEKLSICLVEQIFPQYILADIVNLSNELVALKDLKTNVHKICIEIDLFQKQINGTMTKNIVEKMQKPQQKLAQLTDQLAPQKKQYLDSITALYNRFNETKKSVYTALQFYEQQYLRAIEKYLVNHAAKPCNPPFADYSDMTAILPEYLHLRSSEDFNAEQEA